MKGGKCQKRRDKIRGEKRAWKKVKVGKWERKAEGDEEKDFLALFRNYSENEEPSESSARHVARRFVSFFFRLFLPRSGFSSTWLIRVLCLLVARLEGYRPRRHHTVGVENKRAVGRLSTRATFQRNIPSFRQRRHLINDVLPKWTNKNPHFFSPFTIKSLNLDVEKGFPIISLLFIAKLPKKSWKYEAKEAKKKKRKASLRKIIEIFPASRISLNK